MNIELILINDDKIERRVLALRADQKQLFGGGGGGGLHKAD